MLTRMGAWVGRFMILSTDFLNGNQSSGITVRNFFTVGGTSLAAPLFVGIVACAQEAAARLHQPPFGFLAPTLYRMRPSSFNDVTGANLPIKQGVHPLPRSLKLQSVVRLDFLDGVIPGLAAGPGYDNATGLGTPGKNFIHNLVGMY